MKLFTIYFSILLFYLFHFTYTTIPILTRVNSQGTGALSMLPMSDSDDNLIAITYNTDTSKIYFDKISTSQTITPQGVQNFSCNKYSGAEMQSSGGRRHAELRSRRHPNQRGPALLRRQ